MKPYIPVLLFALLLAVPARAAHLIGGHLSYECMGGNLFRFTLVIYRDCNGGGATFDSGPDAPFPASVSVYLGSSSTPLDIILLDAPIIESVDLPNYCISPTTCIEKGTYVFNLDLPLNGEPVHVAYQRCCLNATLTNIPMPGETGFTYTLTVPAEAQALCNNSPQFTGMPMNCSVVNVPFSFDHHAVDPDGDSLVYSFCAPFVGGGTIQTNAESPNGVAPSPDLPPPYSPVPFLAPLHSASQPIPGNPAFTIDASTGVVSGTPNVVGRYLYGICMREYRNGVLLGESYLSFQHDTNLAEFTASDDARLDTMQVFPNPASSEVFVAMPGTLGRIEVAVFNAQGIRQPVGGVYDGPMFSFWVDSLPTGLYHIRAMQAGQEHWFKIAVK